MEYTLTVLDTASIQAYIFGSNELRENIGASHLVYQATTRWVQDTLDDAVSKRHNYRVRQNEKRPYKPSFRIETQPTMPCAEVMYAGGGNTFILFRGEEVGDKSLDVARDFVYQLSTRIIEEAPGLNLYAAHEPFAWGNNLPQKIDKALQQLTQLKNEMPVYMPTLGLSVTADCVSTGLPANDTHPDQDRQGTLANRANRQVAAQWHAAWHSKEYKKYNPGKMDANDRLRNMFKFVNNNNYEWTNNLDKIGKLPDRDESFIAVVHADGNGMGKQMMALSHFFRDNHDNKSRAYVTAVRTLSLSYHDTAQAALKCTVRDLQFSLNYHEDKKNRDGDQKRYYGRAKDDQGKMTSYFPFRPIVFGGDDVTWVCAGPWGIPMAHRYLSYLEGQHLPSGNELLADWQPRDAHQKKQIEESIQDKLDLSPTPYACAGVSIVKTHYPISRAYDNSEALLSSAKAQVYRYDKTKRCSAIDWHITTTGLAGDLAEIRQREYETTAVDEVTGRVLDISAMHKLTIRPLLLNEKHSWRNWRNFDNIYRQFKESWFASRNKMMALREALRGGPTAVSEFARTERIGKRLPTLPTSPQAQLGTEAVPLLEENGWVQWPSDRTGQLYRLTDEEEKQKAIDPIRCIYFDAIEIEDQLLKLVKHSENCEDLT